MIEREKENSQDEKNLDSWGWEIHMMKIMLWVRGRKIIRDRRAEVQLDADLHHTEGVKKTENIFLARRAGQPCISENKGVLEFFPAASLSSSSPSQSFMTIS